MKINAITSADGLGQDDPNLASVVMSEILATSPLIGALEFYRMAGNADTLVKPGDRKPFGQSRSLNEGYEPAIAEVATDTLTLKILGGKMQIDQALIRRYNDPQLVGDMTLREIRDKAKEFAVTMEDLLINGTGVGNQISGIKTLNQQTVKFLTDNGGALGLGNTSAEVKVIRQFKEYLNKLRKMVRGGATHFIADERVITRVALACEGSIQRLNYQNAVGDNIVVTSFEGVPFIPISNTISDGAGAERDVMGFGETLGTSTTCGSIYAVRFGERRDLTCPTNKGLIFKYLGIKDPFIEYLLEIDMNLGTVDEKSIAALKGIMLEA